MKVAVITDSNSGFTQETAKASGVFCIDMPVIIDGKDYIQGVNLTTEYFYECLTGGKAVTTSQPAPGVVMKMWDDVLNLGYDEIVYIPMSSELSMSCSTAKMLAEEYDGKVEVVDNHRISVTMMQSVFDALKMVEKGYSAGKIRERLEETAFDSSIYIAVDTLEYLKKGGRITAAGATLGTALGIKPILTIQGGKLDAFAKVRGIKKCESKIINAMKNDIETRFAGYKKDELLIFTAGTLITEEEEHLWKSSVQEAFPDMKVIYYPLPLSIGVHIGPGSMAVALARAVNE